MSHPGHVWRRWIGVLGRSRAKHATLPASLPSLPYVSRGAGVKKEEFT
jgi:hypothetical protein